MKDTAPAVRDVQALFYELFGNYQFTGERQLILAGLFSWLKDNEFSSLSAGEVKAALRYGFPEVLE